MPSMLSRRWHIFPPKKPVFEGWAACASGEWSSYQFRRDLDAPPSLPPSLVRKSHRRARFGVLTKRVARRHGKFAASRLRPAGHAPRQTAEEPAADRALLRRAACAPPPLERPSRAARRSRSGRRACAEPTGPVNVHYAGMARPARFGLATYRAPTAVVPTRDTARPPV